MSDLKSKFEAALAQRKKQKAEEASRGNSKGLGFAEIPYSALYTDKQQAFRFAGLPYLVREKPTDSKRIHVAMILGDDDKKFRCIGPDPREHKDWLLYRVMNKVLSRHWDKNVPGSNGQLGAYVYDCASVHPELYNRVAKNNNVENTWEKGWRFTPAILFNVIDRANYDWHRENKKFRVLSKKASEWNDTVYFEPGVPDTIFQLIMDDIVAIDGNTNWEDYDIVIRKIDDNPWYKVYHGVDDFKKLDDGVKALIVNNGLSDEERSWEMNDFDALFRVTPYYRIKSKIGLFIQQEDKIFGTHYYDELVSLVDKEEAEIVEKQTQFPPADDEVPPEKVAKTMPSPGRPAELNSSPQSLPAPSATPASLPEKSYLVRSAGTPAKSFAPMTGAIWAGLADGSYNGKTYLGVPGMTAEEKAWVKGLYEDGSFEWAPEAGVLCEGELSHFVSGENCHIDPLSGVVFG
jgi:hypothetical protein